MTKDFQSLTINQTADETKAYLDGKLFLHYNRRLTKEELKTLFNDPLSMFTGYIKEPNWIRRLWNRLHRNQGWYSKG